MDIGGNNAKEWAPFPLVSQLGSDIDGILNDKSENIGGDNEHILDKEDFFGNTIYKILIHPGLKNCEHRLDLFSKKVIRNNNPEGQYGQIVCM